MKKPTSLKSALFAALLVTTFACKNSTHDTESQNTGHTPAESVSGMESNEINNSDGNSGSMETDTTGTTLPQTDDQSSGTTSGKMEQVP